MSWFVAALVAAVALSGQGLSFQRLHKLLPITTYMAYVWLGSAALLAIVFLRPEHFAAIGANWLPLVLAGASSWIGNYAFNQAIKTQNNIGYIEGIITIRTAITYVFSLVAFSAPFDIAKLVGVVVVTFGVLIISESLPFQAKSTPIPKASANDRFGWLAWSLLAAAMFTVLTIFVRYATDGGVSGEVAIVVVLLVAGLMFISQGTVERTSFVIRRKHILILLIAIACATIGNAADFISYANTPNLAYSIAISNTRMLILYIVGLTLFSEPFQRLKAFGIALTFVGVIFMA
ncbi:MAG: hypothetical protein CL607_07225 [Anaerolineaceae bacterium]|nr:hypothetical protein [Anaerolineaceae bacterium]